MHVEEVNLEEINIIETLHCRERDIIVVVNKDIVWD